MLFRAEITTNRFVMESRPSESYDNAFYDAKSMVRTIRSVGDEPLAVNIREGFNAYSDGAVVPVLELLENREKAYKISNEN